MASASIKDPGTEASVDDDIAEFAMLFGSTSRNLKSAGASPSGLRDALERSGLGPRHMAPLSAIALAGPLSVTRLSEILGLQLSTTSTMVGELSRAGLVERIEDDDDRRRTIVEIAEVYREELRVKLDGVLAPVRATFEELSPQARVHFMEGWRLLSREAARGGGSSAESDCDE